MRALFVSLFGVFALTATVTHIWTVIIAFSEGGFLGGLVTFILPFLSELYWMIEMWDKNDLYSTVALLHLVLAIPFVIFGRE
jgi:hypothetical protein